MKNLYKRDNDNFNYLNSKSKIVLKDISNDDNGILIFKDKDFETQIPLNLFSNDDFKILKSFRNFLISKLNDKYKNILLNENNDNSTDDNINILKHKRKRKVKNYINKSSDDEEEEEEEEEKNEKNEKKIIKNIDDDKLIKTIINQKNNLISEDIEKKTNKLKREMNLFERVKLKIKDVNNKELNERINRQKLCNADNLIINNNKNDDNNDNLNNFSNNNNNNFIYLPPLPILNKSEENTKNDILDNIEKE